MVTQNNAQTVLMPELATQSAVRKRPSLPLFRSLLRNRFALIASIILVIAIFVAVFADYLAPHSPNEISLKERLKPPFGFGGQPTFILGTDSLGRDVLSRIIYGARTSLTVGFAAVLISGLLGVTLGLIAGYFHGWTDNVISRIMDIQLAFPVIVLAIAVLAFLGPGLLNVILVLGVAGWVTYGRLVRGETLSLNEREFVQAAFVVGVPTHRIITRHILPNVFTPILVVASFAVSSAIIAEATLSFLGLGVPPKVPSWGSMLSEGRDYIGDAWWLALFPGLAIVFVVLAINLLGDWLRDYLDPRLKSSQS
jgi:peptide/nickel transport system permease protein